MHFSLNTSFSKSFFPIREHLLCYFLRRAVSVKGEIQKISKTNIFVYIWIVDLISPELFNMCYKMPSSSLSIEPKFASF